MQTLYEEYALVKAKMAELENQEDALRTKILEQMIDNGEEKVETAMGSFKKAMLKKWTYTPKVSELNEEFKAQKAKEESNGDATFVEQPSLRYTPVKFYVNKKIQYIVYFLVPHTTNCIIEV